jgi:hypothetical protein
MDSKSPIPPWWSIRRGASHENCGYHLPVGSSTGGMMQVVALDSMHGARIKRNLLTLRSLGYQFRIEGKEANPISCPASRGTPTDRPCSNGQPRLRSHCGCSTCCCLLASVKGSSHALTTYQAPHVATKGHAGRSGASGWGEKGLGKGEWRAL